VLIFIIGHDRRSGRWDHASCMIRILCGRGAVKPLHPLDGRIPRQVLRASGKMSAKEHQSTTRKYEMNVGRRIELPSPFHYDSV
ncbi:MAG: hypothetical protein ACKPKO_27400, partial [Candidatus Fonsibacter sp.]